jgi:DNA replication protein DnaC
MPEITDKASYVRAKMKQFKLVDMREQYGDIIAEAEKASLGYMDFLVRLLSVEEEGKMLRRSAMLLEKASFDSTVSLEDIDYSFNPSLNQAKIEELGKLHFLDAHENIIIIGPPGVGKSMIATGIGRNACAAGRKVLFANAKELVDKLYDEMAAGRLPEILDRLNHIELLIIDELSYIKMDRERESLFFQIIRQRYEKRSLIITTNLPMGRWNELFTGQLAATAILDRLLHHCHVLSITGESYRVKGSKLSVNKGRSNEQNQS